MQHILITGGNSGIGKATAIALARKGAKIIIASRNKAKTDQAVIEIREETKSQEIYSLHCDLASLDSIRKCAQTYRNQFDRLDILINNAGLVTDKLQLTEDGFELQIGVNHMGHFLLTTQLIDLLEQANEARIINVSSNAHYTGKMTFDTFRGVLNTKKYDGTSAYRQSKLANILFTKELARRYPTLCCHSLHPGVVRTEIAQKNGNGTLWKVIWKLFSPFMLTTKEGAKTSVYVATSPEVLKTNGKYFEKQKEKAPSDLASDIALAGKLWDISEKLVR